MARTEKTCRRCGYEWMARHTPVTMCPRCKSRLWNEQKETEQGKRTDLATRRGQQVDPHLVAADHAVIDFLANLRREIAMRRKANKDERLRHNWNLDAVAKWQQTDLLDWIENQLDTIIARKST